ncbi:MAG: aryl-sulfate sulfotransferase [Proteobacteria bacterium]|nr:aryl-sulfate sulfotransferase [Pseudomonadota bacterium]
MFRERPHFQLDPNGRTPLSGLLTFATNVETVPRITIFDGERRWNIRDFDGQAASSHEQVVLGLRPGRNHTMEIAVRDATGTEFPWDEPITFTAPPLPDDLPELTFAGSDPDRMEPGATVFCVRKSARFGPRDYGYLVAVDSSGEVVWLYDARENLGDFRQLANGNVIYLAFDNRALEIDLLGNVVAQWYAARRWPEAHAGTSAIPVDTDTFHHEIYEMPNGNLLTLSTEVREFPDYPTSETDPDAPVETTKVVGDVVVEFSRDGSIAHAWSIFDVCDAYRICYLSLCDYWVKKGLPDTRDWSHGNAVVYDENDDSFVVSLRHQDAVIKIDRSTGGLVWILGTPDGWRAPWSERLLTPRNDFQWPYHQHNCEIAANGNVFLFDNGNFRARPFEPKLPAPENYSRVVEFAVDGDKRTVSQAWSFGGPGPGALYSTFISSAARLPETGNVLVNFGGLTADEDGRPTDDVATGYGWVRIVEVTHDPDPEVLFELFIDERAKRKGWDVYRVRRFSLF